MGWASDAKRQCWTDRPLGRTTCDGTPTTKTIIVTYSWSSFWQGSRNDPRTQPTWFWHGYDNDMTICQVNKSMWNDQTTFLVRKIMIPVIIITMIIIIDSLSSQQQLDATTTNPISQNDVRFSKIKWKRDKNGELTPTQSRPPTPTPGGPQPSSGGRGSETFGTTTEGWGEVVEGIWVWLRRREPGRYSNHACPGRWGNPFSPTNFWRPLTFGVPPPLKNGHRRGS